jgi:hypothetical protein
MANPPQITKYRVSNSNFRISHEVCNRRWKKSNTLKLYTHNIITNNRILQDKTLTIPKAGVRRKVSCSKPGHSTGWFIPTMDDENP